MLGSIILVWHHHHSWFWWRACAVYLSHSILLLHHDIWHCVCRCRCGSRRNRPWLMLSLWLNSCLSSWLLKEDLSWLGLFIEENLSARALSGLLLNLMLLLLLILSLVIKKRGGSLGLRLLLLWPTILSREENSCRLLRLESHLRLFCGGRCVAIITEHGCGIGNRLFLVSLTSSVHVIVGVEVVWEASSWFFLKVRLYILHLRVSIALFLLILLLLLLMIQLILLRIASRGWIELIVILEPTIYSHILLRWYLVALWDMTLETTCLLVAILLVIVEVVGKAELLGLSKGFYCWLSLRLCDVAHACFKFIIDFCCVIIIVCEKATRRDNWLFFDWLIVIKLLLFLRYRCLASITTAEERTGCTHRLFVFLDLLTLNGKVWVVVVAVIVHNLLLNFLMLLFRAVVRHRIVLIEVTLSLHIVHISG